MIYSSNGVVAWPNEDVEVRGRHIWIKTVTYKFTVYVEPVDGTIVESVAEVLPLNDECEEIKGL